MASPLVFGTHVVSLRLSTQGAGVGDQRTMASRNQGTNQETSSHFKFD